MLGLGHRQRAVHEQSDHVDAARLLLPVRLRAVELEEHAQLALLALVDRLLRRAERSPAARLHLDEHEGVAVLSDDVDLTEAAPPVAREDAETLLLEVRERGNLARVADTVLEWPAPEEVARGSRPPATLRRRSPRLRPAPSGSSASAVTSAVLGVLRRSGSSAAWSSSGSDIGVGDRVGLGTEQRHLGAADRLTPLADAGMPADLLAQVEKLCPAHLAVTQHFDLVDARSVHEEGALDADTMGDTADGEARRETDLALERDHNTLEHLDALAGAFNDLDVHAHGVA